MRSVFLYPFKRVIEKAHIEAVMPSYNETNGGIPSNANPWLLKQVLRKEWGFTGKTVSDYLAVAKLASRHHVVADTAAAGLLAFKAGVDMELPAAAGFPALVDAVKTGKVSQQDLDESVSSGKYVARLKGAKRQDNQLELAFGEGTTSEARSLSVEGTEAPCWLVEHRIVTTFATNNDRSIRSIDSVAPCTFRIPPRCPQREARSSADTASEGSRAGS